jgi:energy-coupling factor transporter ATP-binding protein EcfA2/ribonuclease HI
MNLKRLQVADLRAFKQAAFEFNSRMTLLVGVNGVGKTTVLDALRICLSKILPAVTSSRSRGLPFTDDDIRGSTSAMTVQLGFELGGREFEFLVHKQREGNVAHKTGIVREQTIETPDKGKCTPDLSVLGESFKAALAQPLGIFFATRRSLVSDSNPTSGSAAGGQSAAFADALSNTRELRLAEIAYWMHAQDELGRENPRAKEHSVALVRAAKGFLPECKHLRAEASPKPRLLVEKGRVTLDVRQLSDGERSILALVLDLARRLSQANPGLANPVKQGQGIVLIDELDLHLHPKWQRTIVERLTKTFDSCQFVVTTHSPQIVAAVEPEQVLLLTDSGIVQPDRTLGMDSNWILRHLMEADERPLSAAKLIQEVEALIKSGSFKKARKAVASARDGGLDLPEWSVLEARMARLEVLTK